MGMDVYYLLFGGGHFDGWFCHELKELDLILRQFKEKVDFYFESLTVTVSRNLPLLPRVTPPLSPLSPRPPYLGSAMGSNPQCLLLRRRIPPNIKYLTIILTQSSLKPILYIIRSVFLA